MPSLDGILKDTLMMIGAAANPAQLKEFEPGINDLAGRPSPNPALGSAAQPVWAWDYSGVREINQGMPMNRVEDLEAWSRTVADMHGVDQGWMTVAKPLEWGPVVVTLPFERVALPLTQKYFVKGLMLASGNNPGTNAWWPLPADLDQSFASVFLYDLTSRQQNQAPATVDSAHFNSATFMPDPNVEPGNLPVGSTGVTEDRHFICVVLSLVCMQERPDFEPGGIVGMGRFYPHFMIMSNKRIPQVISIAGSRFNCGMEATVRVTRPDPSGYHGTFANPGGAPRVMQHPDMDPAMLPLLITEPNTPPGLDLLKLLSIPYWDLMFDYFLPIDYRGGATGPLPRNQSSRVVDRGHAGVRPVKGVLKHLDYSKLLNVVMVALANPTVLAQVPAPLRALGIKVAQIALSRPSLQAIVFGNFFSMLQIGTVSASDFLPRVKKDLIKLPGQGTFDNLHLAPRMKAHQVIGRPEMNDPKWQSSLDTLDTLRMAPFCEHDCMHTHWRWGLAFKLAPNQLPIQGFAGDADARFAGTGKPYRVLGNPMVPLNQDIDIAFGGNQQFIYTARITDIAPGVWQPVYHHGSAYVLGFSTVGAVLHSASKAAIANSQEDAELYWNMRYQATVDGALERVLLDSFDLHRATTASNTIRIHTKVLEEPENIRIEAMLANAKALLQLHRIDLVEASRETFTDADEQISRFKTLVVNEGVPTDDQTALFDFRGEAEPDDLVIYFVRTLVPAQAGCAGHPLDKPGAIVSALLATEWTLAHQIGHVLGLEHVDAVNRLMTRHSTDAIEVTIPELADDEVATLMNSPFVKV